MTSLATGSSRLFRERTSTTAQGRYTVVAGSQAVASTGGPGGCSESPKAQLRHARHHATSTGLTSARFSMGAAALWGGRARAALTCSTWCTLLASNSRSARCSSCSGEVSCTFSSPAPWAVVVAVAVALSMAPSLALHSSSTVPNSAPTPASPSSPGFQAQKRTPC